MRGGGGGEGELGTISSELVLWVSTAAEGDQRGATLGLLLYQGIFSLKR